VGSPAAITGSAIPLMNANTQSKTTNNFMVSNP
jgi:hypothetical protein